VAFAAFAVIHGKQPVALGQTAPGRTIALTFDDLPYVAIDGADFVRSADRVADEILPVLRAHKAPATGFVNEGKLDGEFEARVRVLKRWVDAGVLLGNHTYSHPDFNRLSVSRFEDEITRGDIVSRQLLDSRGPYQLYFRFPETHTGDTLEKKQAVERFLAGRGYRVAPHTIENSDFVFNVPYVGTRRSGDFRTSERLVNAYVDFTMAATSFAERITPKIFGRDIPQTLLVHSNDITADTLERLLATFEARGYRFITLDEAMKDEAYHTRDTLVTRAGPTWLWRWMKSKGMNLSFKDDPEPPAWVSDLYSRR
jgi:peptidoglycan/xylan/chitin deacetylase (PgdA/CDA1 family)